MTTLSDRLRGIIGGGLKAHGGSRSDGGSTEQDPPYGCGDPAYAANVADVLDGEWHERDGHRFLVVDRTYVPGYRHGSMVLADGLPPSDGVWPRLSLLANGSCGSRLLFIDLETTGIAGGAGTYAFLVGCGWFAGGTFRVRQFVLSSFTAERALLEAVGELAAESGTVVSYNGKSFDLPLIETRFALHRLPSPFGELPHIDMLHPARRMWRVENTRRVADASVRHVQKDVPYTDQKDVAYTCRLSTLEQHLCGYVREGDVAGFEIPARYFRYVHAGDPRPLAAVLEHNRLDLLSLALVTARAAQLLEDGPAAARTAREALGMGRLYERGGMMTEAKSSFARALEIKDADEDLRAEALRAYAIVARRLRHYDDAADAWRRVLGLNECPRPIEREASEALAVHHEHRRRDLASARDFTLRLLNVDESTTRRQATEYRLARLDRKLESQALQPALLF
jgi:uncharacterized protein YprB with RNaseH-like and TPR domain